jgi:hypothetical protein
MVSDAPQSVSPKVTPQMVADTFKSGASNEVQGDQASLSPDNADPLKGLTMPASLEPAFQGYYGASNKDFLANALREIPRGDRQSILNEVSSALQLAPAGTSPAQVVGRFFSLRNSRLKTSKAASTERMDHYKSGFLQIGIGLALVALFSLVLVLLAIERNTRPQQA